MPVPPYPYLLNHLTSPPAPTPTPYHNLNPNQVLKNAISAQINIPAQYIELELDGTVVSIDIFIGGERGAPAANLTDSSGDSSGGGTGTGGTGGAGGASSGGASLPDVAALTADSTAQCADETLTLTLTL